MEKVLKILVTGRTVSAKESVIAWISFIFSEAAVLGTMGRQLGGKKSALVPELLRISWEIQAREEVILMQGTLKRAFPRLEDIPVRLLKDFGPRRPSWI